MTFSCTTALWEALARDVPNGLTLGRTQKDSVEGTVREQSGPERKNQDSRQGNSKKKEALLMLVQTETQRAKTLLPLLFYFKTSLTQCVPTRSVKASSKRYPLHQS